MQRYKKLLFFTFFLTTEILFPATFGEQSIFTKETGTLQRKQKSVYSQNNFSTFEGLGGRNAFGFNFATVIYGVVTKPLFEMATDIIEPYATKFGIEDYVRGETQYGFAFSIYYDFAISDYFSVGGEFGLGNLGGDFVIIDTIINTIPWSINTKFFPAGNAPVGFYLQPKFGATHITIDGEYFNGVKFVMQSMGLYASIEVGWRITLFPRKALAEEVRNRIALDISIIDVGYYFKPWNGEIYGILDAFGINEFNKFKKASSMRILPFPKIGITFTF